MSHGRSGPPGRQAYLRGDQGLKDEEGPPPHAKGTQGRA